MDGSGAEFERAGSRSLGILSSHTNVQIMRAMSGGFEASTERFHELPPDFEPDPDEPTLGITKAGMESLPVASAVEYWLLKAPGGPMAYAEPRAEEAIEALSKGWGMGLIHALANGPMSPAALERALGLDRSLIMAVLEPMQRAGEVDARDGEGEDATYAVTDWTRRAVGPILLAARMERRTASETRDMIPIDGLDLESAMMLALPLLRLPTDLSGSCRLVFRITAGPQPPRAGVTVGVEEGRVVSCAPGLDNDAPAEASGNVRVWFRAVIDGAVKRLDYSGNPKVPRTVVRHLHEILFVAG